MADGRMAAYGNMGTRADSAGSAQDVLRFAMEALEGFSEDRIDYLIGTGYGRVHMPMADRKVTEVACHARGAHFLYGSSVRTVLDVGGQDIKAIRCDERGKVTDFLMNDKCAAGTGRGMDSFADLLGVPIEEMGDRSFEVEEEPEAVSNTCVVYAKSEAAGLLRRGWSREAVLAAYCRAAAERIHALVDRLGAEPAFAVTGGVAKNRGVMDRLIPMTGLEALKTEWDPQLAGAVGGALFGYTLCRKGKKRKKK